MYLGVVCVCPCTNNALVQLTKKEQFACNLICALVKLHRHNFHVGFYQAHLNCLSFKFFTGIVYSYTIIQLGIFWLCHVSVIFMKTQFLFYSRGLEKSKTIHITVVRLAVLLHCIPVIAAFSTGGYMTALHPQILCIAKNTDTAYFSFEFVLSVITAIGGPLLVITFMITIKVIYMHLWYFKYL